MVFIKEGEKMKKQIHSRFYRRFHGKENKYSGFFSFSFFNRILFCCYEHELMFLWFEPMNIDINKECSMQRP